MKTPFTQTREYLGWQEGVGNKTFHKEFFGYSNGIGFVQISAAAVLLNTRAGNILYFPFGPVVAESVSKETKNEFVVWAKQIARENNCIFIRLESGLNRFADFADFISPPIRTYAREGLWQPRLEWVLDLNLPLEKIYENFSKDCRYSIRRCEKEMEVGNVKIEIVEDFFLNYLHDFLVLMNETSERGGFINHEDKYFESVFRSLNEKKLKGYLVVGKVKNDDGGFIINSMAVVVVDNDGERANYVYGGSKNFKREIGVSYKVQWEAIKHSFDTGCKYYSFGGINNNQFGNSKLSGVTNFKKQFGGHEEFNGYFYDIPIKKLKYLLYLIYKMVK